jgi:large subunit ribosomal protein L18
MVVNRSLRHIEVQLVDDVTGHSLLGLSTQCKDLKNRDFDSRVEQGREVGKIVAAKAQEKGIEQVVFDRGGFLYHGVIKAVADGAREAGLNF